MSRRRRPEDLTEAELRQLLIRKRLDARSKRLDEFRRSGRVASIAPSPLEAPLEDFRTRPILASDEDHLDPKESRRKRLFDRMLLAVEVLAIGGLVFVLFNGVSLVQRLNQEVAAALSLPTLTPTPLVRAVVLPSGHTPPTSPGGAQPNEAEIPEHLRPLVQSLANLAIPTPGPEQAVRIQIPAIGVDAPIVQGDGWEQLKKGVGQHLGTPNPGQDGNLILSAHNDIFGEIFRHLDQLQPGDEVIVYTNIRAYTYVITGTQIVEPTFVEVMESTPDPILTLVSCYPYLVDTERIVIQAALQN